MSVVSLVQGASRGLGLEFCKHILKRGPNYQVIATCRDPNSAIELQNLCNQYSSNLTVHQLDVCKDEHIKHVSGVVKEQYGKLDLLINSAGMLHPSGRGETSLNSVTTEGLAATLHTNAVGPVIMAKHFAPLLMKGTGGFGSQEPSKHCGVLVNMSAKVGSITDNGLGGWYSYRMSKAALNMATKNLSIELGRGRNTKVIVVSLHPGTVDTNLSRPYHKNVPKEKLFSTQYSVDCLMKIIDNLKVTDSGKYLSWDGSELPF